MKLLLQRVSMATVKAEGEVVGSIGRGFLLFLGIEEFDTEKEVDYLINKVLKLRIFENELGKLDYSILDISGDLLVVSQFTLCGSTRKGNRPSFSSAKKPTEAEALYLSFIKKIKVKSLLKVESGLFGANMNVELTNEGPFTLLLENRCKI